MYASSFARWTFRHDPARTRVARTSLSNSGHPQCDCATCRNFRALGENGLPPRLRSLLSELGINWAYPVELEHYGSSVTGLHSYNGWYHFVGEGLAGRDGWQQKTPNSWTEDFEQIDKDLKIGLTTRLDLVPVELKPHPVLQLGFAVNLPWVLDEIPPD